MMVFVMRRQLGIVLQALVLMTLPLLIGWQLFFGMPLIWMPALTLVGIAIFSAGHVLRNR